MDQILKYVACDIYKQEKKGIFTPVGGWKPSTYYVVEVKYRSNNFLHRKIFYSGFISKNGDPAGYNQFFEGNDDGATYNTEIQKVYYARALYEIQLTIENP